MSKPRETDLRIRRRDRQAGAACPCVKTPQPQVPYTLIVANGLLETPLKVPYSERFDTVLRPCRE